MIQKLSLALTLALILTLIWTTLTHADGPGDLDLTFGGTGVVTTSISNGSDGGFAVALQPDGKILVAGTNNGGDGFAVIRYDTNGSLDTTFNNTGVVTTSINENDYYGFGFAIAVQPDGRILVGGTSTGDFALVRYHSDGILDTNFNTTGIVTTSTKDANSEIGWSIATQTDGKIILAGESEFDDGLGLRENITIIRYKSDGSLDNEFNNTGIVTTTIGTHSFASSVTLQPNGKIIAAGGGDSALAVVRYNDDGSLDAEFNGTGIVTTTIGSRSSASSVMYQPNGKIIVAGGSDDDFALARYNPDGSLDTSFNQTGIVTTSVQGDESSASSVAIQSNGKMVVAGISGEFNAPPIGDLIGDIALLRYNPDGSLDTTFQGTGIVTTSLSDTRDDPRSMVIQPDGKIIVAGFADGNNQAYFFVARYLGDPILNLTKSIGDPSPALGQAISYTLTLSNSGTTTATGLTLIDALDNNTIFASASNDGLHQSGVVSWSIASLAPNQTMTRTVTVTASTVTSGTLLTNAAWLTSAQALTTTASVTATVVIEISEQVWLPTIFK